MYENTVKNTVIYHKRYSTIKLLLHMMCKFVIMCICFGSTAI